MLRKIEKNITKQYGIIGNPLCHSLSPQFFNERFAQKNIPSEYVKFEISSIEEFPNIIKKNPMLVGLNVTIPYKQAVIPYLDELDEHAKAMGAVNVVKVETREDGTKYLKGYNTDWYDELLNEGVVSHRHSVSMTGGTAVAKVYANFMTQDQKGIAIGDGRKDYEGRINGHFNTLDNLLEGT